MLIDIIRKYISDNNREQTIKFNIVCIKTSIYLEYYQIIQIIPG